MLTVVVSIVLGARMPSKKSEPSSKSWCLYLVPPDRDDSQVPFFFYEVRIATLVVSLLFTFCRLVYVAIVADVSVISVAVRLVFTVLQIVYHLHLCRNWQRDFLTGDIAPVLSFRFYYSWCLFFWVWSLEVIFDGQWVHMSVRFVIGLALLIMYYWVRHFTFFPLVVAADETRRYRALRNISAIIAVLAAGQYSADYVQRGAAYANKSSAIHLMVVFSILAVIEHTLERRRLRLDTAVVTSAVKDDALIQLSKVKRRHRQRAAYSGSVKSSIAIDAPQWRRDIDSTTSLPAKLEAAGDASEREGRCFIDRVESFETLEAGLDAATTSAGAVASGDFAAAGASDPHSTVQLGARAEPAASATSFAVVTTAKDPTSAGSFIHAESASESESELGHTPSLPLRSSSSRRRSLQAHIRNKSTGSLGTHKVSGASGWRRCCCFEWTLTRT